jgi:hypothetical protein
MAVRVIYQNDTRHLLVQIADPRDASGLYNLSQAQAIELAIGDCPAGAIQTFSFVAGAVTVGPPANGQVSLTLDPAQTALLPEGKHQMRIRVIESDGDRYTVYTEAITVRCAM